MSPNASQNVGHGQIDGKLAFQPSPNPTAITRKGHTSPLTTPPKEVKWNIKDLPWRITTDIMSAACASGLVAPLITIIDRYFPHLPYSIYATVTLNHY